jgi:hypothetical protein
MEPDVARHEKQMRAEFKRRVREKEPKARPRDETEEEQE